MSGSDFTVIYGPVPAYPTIDPTHNWYPTEFGPWYPAPSPWPSPRPDIGPGIVVDVKPPPEKPHEEPVAPIVDELRRRIKRNEDRAQELIAEREAAQDKLDSVDLETGLLRELLKIALVGQRSDK